MSYKNRTTRKTIFKRDGWRCYICSRRLVNAPTTFNHKKGHTQERREMMRISNLYATLDHYVPYHTTKDQTVDNLKTCCDYCNHHKGEQIPCTPLQPVCVTTLSKVGPEELGRCLTIPPLSIIGGSIHVVGAGMTT